MENEWWMWITIQDNYKYSGNKMNACYRKEGPKKYMNTFPRISFFLILFVLNTNVSCFGDCGVRPSHIPPFTKKICIHANFLYTSSINPLKQSCTKVFMINSRTISIPQRNHASKSQWDPRTAPKGIKTNTSPWKTWSPTHTVKCDPVQYGYSTVTRHTMKNRITLSRTLWNRITKLYHHLDNGINMTVLFANNELINRHTSYLIHRIFRHTVNPSYIDTDCFDPRVEFRQIAVKSN